MPNEENLRPLCKRTTSEQREFHHKGGVASGAARRRKRSLKDAASLFLSLPPADVNVWNAVAMEGVEPEDVDNQMAVITALYRAALKGNTKAAKLLFDLLGENPGAEDAGPREDEGDMPLSEREALLREIAKDFGGREL